jgi:exodeoxyribonuclease-3
VKIGTWNVNGIRKRSTEVLSWIDREEPDVVCLQETKAALAQIPEHILEVPGYHCHWHGRCSCIRRSTWRRASSSPTSAR